MTTTPVSISDFTGAQAALDPIRASLAGAPVIPGALTDYSPAGRSARADRLRALGGSPAVTERIDAEAGYAAAFLDAELNLVASPPTLLREHLMSVARDADADVLAASLSAVPGVLRGYAETLRTAPVPPARLQVESVLGAAGHWAVGGTEFGDTPAAAIARAGYAEFAEVLAAEVLPIARTEPGVGVDRYSAAARFHLGEDVELARLREVLLAELGRLRAECAALAPDGVKAACAAYNADPTWEVTGPDQLRAWITSRLETAATLAARDVPAVDVGGIDVHVPLEPGPVRYLPPAAHGTRPARLVWPLSSADSPMPVWSQVTTVHHEGLPGHHLQLGAASGEWPSHAAVAGNSEGWAVHAEGLMLAAGGLPTPAEHLGYLLGLRLNAAMALADLSVHTGVPLADTGDPWSLDRAAAFLSDESAFPASSLYFTALRSAAWPAQALTYTWGALAWRDLADRAAATGLAAHDFHTRALALGPCGLATLRTAFP